MVMPCTPCSAERVLDVFELEVPDDRFDFLHGFVSALNADKRRGRRPIPAVSLSQRHSNLIQLRTFNQHEDVAFFAVLAEVEALDLFLLRDAQAHRRRRAP